jgi:hypothetical protein
MILGWPAQSISTFSGFRLVRTRLPVDDVILVEVAHALEQDPGEQAHPLSGEGGLRADEAVEVACGTVLKHQTVGARGGVGVEQVDNGRVGEQGQDAELHRSPEVGDEFYGVEPAGLLVPGEVDFSRVAAADALEEDQLPQHH